MLNIIMYHANVYCPTVKMFVNETCPYWYSRDSIEEINHKYYLYRKANASGKEEDWLALQCQRNLTKRLIFSAKDVYINEQIDHNLNDSKKLWRTLNVGGKKKNPLVWTTSMMSMEICLKSKKLQNI